MPSCRPGCRARRSEPTDWVVGLVETLGAPGAGVAVAPVSTVWPIPSEIVLP